MIVNGQTGLAMHHAPKLVVVEQSRDKDIRRFKNPMEGAAVAQTKTRSIVIPKIALDNMDILVSFTLPVSIVWSIEKKNHNLNPLLFNSIQLIVSGQTGLVMDHVPKVVVAVKN